MDAGCDSVATSQSLLEVEPRDGGVAIDVTVRRVRPDEAAQFRAIRLAALRDSPTAFGSTLEETELRPREYWESRVTQGAEGRESVLFVAVDNGRWVGLAGGFLEISPGEYRADVVSMWVRPDCRGVGVGRALLSEVIEWARDHGAARADLWVTETNAAARGLYRSLGFIETGETQPLPSHPELLEYAMVLDLRQR